MKVLVIVDMQEDFIRGTLGNPHNETVVENIVKYLKEESEKEVFAVVTTLDTHGDDYLQTQEGKNLPVAHCIRGTAGHKLDATIDRTIQELDDADKIIYLDDYNKSCFGCVDIGEELLCDCEGHDIIIDEIILMGLCTEICVISNAVLLKTFFEEVPMSVVKDCCAGVTPERHEAALTVMEAIQIKIV